MRTRNPDHFKLSSALQKSPARSTSKKRIKTKKTWRKKQPDDEDAKKRWHHLRTAGSAIIPRPFEFSSFVITTNTRQMKRAKGESVRGWGGERRDVGEGGEGREWGKEERRRRAVINGVSAASESSARIRSPMEFPWLLYWISFKFVTLSGAMLIAARYESSRLRGVHLSFRGKLPSRGEESQVSLSFRARTLGSGLRTPRCYPCIRNDSYVKLCLPVAHTHRTL